MRPADRFPHSQIDAVQHCRTEYVRICLKKNSLPIGPNDSLLPAMMSEKAEMNLSPMKTCSSVSHLSFTHPITTFRVTPGNATINTPGVLVLDFWIKHSRLLLLCPQLNHEQNFFSPFKKVEKCLVVLGYFATNCHYHNNNYYIHL